MSNPNLILTYGNFQADFNTLPESSLVAMLRRGFGHFMGSEAASKVTAAFDPDNETQPTESKDEYKAKVQAEFMAKLVAGTVGVSTRGPAVDPLVTIGRRLAKGEIIPILKANGLAWPKKSEDVVTFPNGDKFTGAQLVDRRLAGKEGPRINAEAKKLQAAEVKKAKQAEDAAKAEGLQGL
jgi:hypothetical protein